MIVLSLFDGMSCGYEALKRAGIYVEKYYSSEIDKYAIQVAQKNHPDIIQLGDINGWEDWDIEKPDLIIGGSPCQGFSFAGKQLAFDDPRSKLFFTMMDIIEYYRPEHKLLENVKMKKEHLDVITQYMDVDPHFINSALVSAQNRQRFYWYNWSAPDPDDKGVLLEDIIEDGFVEKDKSWALLESYSRFPKKTESAKGRYKRSMMPIIFKTSNYSFDDGWRELSVKEMERLQTLQDGYTNSVSEVKAKSMLGNGWTVNVIAHLFKHLPLNDFERLIR